MKPLMIIIKRLLLVALVALLPFLSGCVHSEKRPATWPADYPLKNVSDIEGVYRIETPAFLAGFGGFIIGNNYTYKQANISIAPDTQTITFQFISAKYPPVTKSKKYTSIP